jgi:hypothetical protein
MLEIELVKGRITLKIVVGIASELSNLLQSIWLLNPMQKYFIPNEQFRGTIAPTADPTAATALDVALWASLITLEPTVTATLVALLACVFRLWITLPPGMELGSTGNEMLRLSRLGGN